MGVFLGGNLAWFSVNMPFNKAGYVHNPDHKHGGKSFRGGMHCNFDRSLYFCSDVFTF